MSNPLRIAVVALPWAMPERPSSAVGALVAYLRREQPDLTVAGIHAFVEISTGLGRELYQAIAINAYDVGELLHCAIRFPERRPHVVEHCSARLESMLTRRIPGCQPDTLISPRLFTGRKVTWENAVEVLIDILDWHLDTLADRTARDYDLVGLTTSFGQLFANLAFAQKVKARNPAVQTVLGGSTVSGQVGPSLMPKFEEVDFIIQGEGEQPFAELVRRLRAGEEPTPCKGVISRANAADNPDGVDLWEVENVGQLPSPAIDEYVAQAAEHRITWFLNVEGSRGCWWDRSQRGAQPRKICHFCNVNVLWNGYREKTVERLVAEIDELSLRYENPVLFFTDNIIRLKRVGEFAAALKATGREYVFYYEMRVNISPYEIVELWDAGMRFVLFGIEALSTSLLRRIGKGTTAIQNLQGMKICRELGIDCSSNLLTGFPGSTEEEVQETLDAIERYAFQLQPLQVSKFWLGIGQTVDLLRREFPITNIRNKNFYRVGVPRDIVDSVRFYDLDYDPIGTPASWAPVVEKVTWWERLHANVPADASGLAARPALRYVDCKDYLLLYTDGPHMQRTVTLRGVQRDLFIYLAQIRTRDAIEARFAGRLSPSDIESLLAEWYDRSLIFREGSRSLSMALATDPQRAAKRIRQAREEDLLLRAERPGCSDDSAA